MLLLIPLLMVAEFTEARIARRQGKKNWIFAKIGLFIKKFPNPSPPGRADPQRPADGEAHLRQCPTVGHKCQKSAGKSGEGWSKGGQI